MVLRQGTGSFRSVEEGKAHPFWSSRVCAIICYCSPQGRGQAKAHGPQPPRGGPPPGLIVLVPLRRPHLVLSNPGRDDGLTIRLFTESLQHTTASKSDRSVVSQHMYQCERQYMVAVVAAFGCVFHIYSVTRKSQ